MKYQNQFYHHSYAIMPNEFDDTLFSACESVNLLGHTLVHSTTMDCTRITENNVTLIVLGYVLDIRDGNKTKETIIQDMIHADNFVENLEYINGRFVMIRVKDNQIEYYSDASNLLPGNYHEKSNIIASHDMLLAEILINNGIEVNRRPLNKTNDLDFTRYDSIWKVNPSIKYTLAPFSKTRIYPRVEQTKQSVEAAVQSLKPYFEAQNDWLAQYNGDKFLTLTAGMDSRTSAAIAHSLQSRIEFLTYMTPRKMLATPMAKKIYKIDETVTRDMKDNMNWNHAIINLGDYDVQEDTDYYKEVLNSKHSPRLAQYYKEKGYYKALHIKSTIFGVGKADYESHLDHITDDLNEYKKLMTHFQKDFATYYNVDDELDAYFERNLVTSDVTKGRHYFEVYHLESRLGNWHSTLTSETDPETEEFIYLNTRKLIDLFTSISIDEMRQHKLHKRIIHEFWSVLNYFGVNETKGLWEQLEASGSDSMEFKDMLIHQNGNMLLEETDDGLSVMPASKSISAIENYEIVIRNSTDKALNVNIRSTYRREAGRNKVFVTIKGERNRDRYDVLDINDGVNIQLMDSPIKISVEYTKSYTSDSWKHAGKLVIT